MADKKDTIIRRYQKDFERFVTNTTSEQTASRYKRALDIFFDYFPEKTTPADWGKLDIEDFRVWRRRKVSAVSVNYELQVVRRIWNWMIDNEIAIVNPAKGVRRFKEIEPLKVSMGEATQEKLYDACMNDYENLLVGLALTTGLRAATLRQLELIDFDPEQGTINIPATKTKTGKSLELQIRKDEIDLLTKIAPLVGTIWGTWADTDRALEYKWNKICKRAGLPIRGLRAARRTVATTLLRQGMDVRSVQEWLGHKKITTTMKYLTPATKAETRSALALLPGRYKEKDGEATVQPS